MSDDPALPAEAPYTLRERYSVALFDSADEGHNTLVLGGIDVLVPLEVDLDRDPCHDDAIGLLSAHGLYQRVLSVGDADVQLDPERRIAFYRFRYVLYGVYRLAVRVRDHWVQLGDNLVVSAEGAHWNGRALGDAPPETVVSEAEGELGHWGGTYLVDDERPGHRCGGHAGGE